MWACSRAVRGADMATELIHSVELRAVEFAPEIDCFALVFTEAGGATHRMELPIWAAHQLARVLPRVGVPVDPAVHVVS